MSVIKKVENIFMLVETYNLFKDRLHVSAKGNSL